MGKVAVIAAQDTVAEALVRALRGAPGIEAAERVATGASPIDAPALAAFDTIVYAPVIDGAPASDADQARAICERLASLPLKQVVLISSAAVYTADHEHVGLLDEQAFQRAGRSAIADAWRLVEEASAIVGTRSGTAAPARTVLRAAAVLDGTNYFSRLFKGRIGVTYPGHDPTMQFVSPRDLAGAVASVVSPRVEGVFNVAPAGAIPLVEALRASGTMRLPLPRLLQNCVRGFTGPAKVTATIDQLQYIRFSWTVSGEKLRRTTGFAPADTSAAAIAALTGRDAANVRAFDDFGMDPFYIRRYCKNLFYLLHDYYWRVEIDGIENVPTSGRGVLVGMHRGFMPFDGVMALYALVLQRDRIPRFLIHPSLTRFPFLADFMAKLGGIMACQENGEYVLQHDEILAVFPEGIRGAFTMYSRAYTLGKFRDEFVRMALRNRAPILPFVTVGSAEIYPILRKVDWSWFKRYTEWPFLPITPAPFPLPSKWHTQFLPPMHIENEYPPEAADDPKTVRRISVEVRQRMQAAVDEMLLRRRSIWSGAIFTGANPS